MDIKWLQTFITVYEEDSFRKASEKLFISQPSVTVHIQLLEQALSQQLFTREHTKLSLTPAAYDFYPMAKQLLHSIHETVHKMQTYNKPFRQKLRVGLSTAWSSSKVLKAIYDFQQMYSTYEISIDLIDVDQYESLLQQKQLDLMFSLSKSSVKQIHSEQLVTAPFELICSPKIVPQNLSLDESFKVLLQNYPLLLGYLPSQKLVAEILENEYKPIVTNHTNNLLFALKLIQEGLAVGCIPKFLVEDEVKSGTIHSLGKITSLHLLQGFMNYRKNDEKVQPLLQFFREQL